MPSTTRNILNDAPISSGVKNSGWKPECRDRLEAYPRVPHLLITWIHQRVLLFSAVNSGQLLLF